MAADSSGSLPCQYSSLPIAIETFDRDTDEVVVVTVRSTPADEGASGRGRVVTARHGSSRLVTARHGSKL
jgi:hypothetical protein